MGFSKINELSFINDRIKRFEDQERNYYISCNSFVKSCFYKGFVISFKPRSFNFNLIELSIFCRGRCIYQGPFKSTYEAKKFIDNHFSDLLFWANRDVLSPYYNGNAISKKNSIYTDFQRFGINTFLIMVNGFYGSFKSLNCFG